MNCSGKANELHWHSERSIKRLQDGDIDKQKKQKKRPYWGTGDRKLESILARQWGC